MLLVDRVHQSGRGRDHTIHKQENGLLCGELQAFTDHIDELAASKVCRYQVFFLVDVLRFESYLKWAFW
jgi:hypothetical protein